MKAKCVQTRLCGNKRWHLFLKCIKIETVSLGRSGEVHKNTKEMSSASINDKFNLTPFLIWILKFGITNNNDKLELYEEIWSLWFISRNY